MKLVSFIIGPSVIGVLALILVFAVLNDKEIPLISDYRAAFFALAIMNYVMCAVGPLPRTKSGEWLSPIQYCVVCNWGLCFTFHHCSHYR